MRTPAEARRALSLLALVWAGESIYLLPYALRRDYREVLIDALALEGEAALGAIYSTFGALSLVAYLFGGWLADRVSPRALLTGSLAVTGLSGLVLSTFPTSLPALYALYGLWSVSTILTFWAALIKATRSWGGEARQGRAFGLLDGGRGLVAASFASLGLWVFASVGEGPEGLRAVIWLYSGACFVGALGTFLVAPREVSRSELGALANLGAVARRWQIWVLSGVVLCAYAGYLGTFYFADYAQAAYAKTAAEGARVTVTAVWLRPVVPVLGGLLADRVGARWVVLGCFAGSALAYGSLALLSGAQVPYAALFAQAAGAAMCAYTLRGVYYALLAEGGLPRALTGTAVGLVSIVGYAPDVITPLAWGWLLDAYPGERGYHLLFGSLALCALAGAGLALLHPRRARAAPRLMGSTGRGPTLGSRGDDDDP